LHGGTGGYIYINTSESLARNYVSSGVRIQAKGGYGKNRGYGGAGGIVVGGSTFTYIFSIDAEGGLAGPTGGRWNRTCGNAAAGTTYFWALDLLLIENKGHMSNKWT